MASKKLDALLATLESKKAVKVAVIHSAYEDVPCTVALIDLPEGTSDAEACEKAFMMTNTIESAWYTSKELTYIGPEKSCRSTSVGDMVLVGKNKYECKSIGWEKV